MREREKARIADHLQLQGSSDFGNKNFSIEIAQPKRKRRKRKKNQTVLGAKAIGIFAPDIEKREKCSRNKKRKGKKGKEK